MSDIFISYAREDRNKAELLARVFEQQKWNVWWDKVIPPGKKYSDVIGAELASAKAVIVLWSQASVASDWVKDEALGSEGVLAKITAAPQVSIDDRWSSRPVIRAFVTQAFWSDDFVGRVGGADYATRSNGLSAGMQMEAWW